LFLPEEVYNYYVSQQLTQLTVFAYFSQISLSTLRLKNNLSEPPVLKFEQLNPSRAVWAVRSISVEL